MSDEMKDIAVIIDGEDPLADSVSAGIALRLAHHHGAVITVFEQSASQSFEHLLWPADPNDAPYASVEVCGVSDPRSSEQAPWRTPMSQLLREAHADGRWFKSSDSGTLMERLRCADLVIAGSPLAIEGHASHDPLDVIMHAGRPVLVVPRHFAERRNAQRSFGHRALIAWNASAPSARAIHDALPFLRRAEEVTLLFVNERRSKTGAQHLVAALARHLERHGVTVRPDVSPVGDGGAAQSIRDHLAELDIDLLVMGAFSRSRLAEAWFGSVSIDLLQTVTIPVLTSH